MEALELACKDLESNGQKLEESWRTTQPKEIVKGLADRDRVRKSWLMVRDEMPRKRGVRRE